MKKQQDHAFRKDVYLLGKDAEGVKYWLEAPSWDCDWYWGFGYVETYQQNWAPSKARDISSHQHADGTYKPEGANFSDSNLFTSGYLVETTFTDKEGWTLRELMTIFYQLRSEADFYHRGKSHVAASPLDFGDQKRSDHINQVMIPQVTEAIIAILTPEAN